MRTWNVGELVVVWKDGGYRLGERAMHAIVTERVLVNVGAIGSVNASVTLSVSVIWFVLMMIWCLKCLDAIYSVNR
jgi:hypothetical protein